MMNTTTSQGEIREHMEVICSKGGHVGTVDHVEGDRIKLTKNDSLDGLHHYISSALVEKVDDKVHLSQDGDEVKRMWSPA